MLRHLNIFIGYFSFGEGWHNNHHRNPYSAKFSLLWWEIDTSWAYLLVMSKLKLCQPKLHNYVPENLSFQSVSLGNQENLTIADANAK